MAEDDDPAVPAEFSALVARYREVIELGPVWKLMMITRCYTQLTIHGLSREQMLAIPDDDTSILWNLGHVTFSHDRMLYRPSGLESPLPAHFAELFRPGTSPVTWSWTPDIDEVMAEFEGQFERVQRDQQAGAFEHYVPETIAVGVRLRSLEEAMAFNVAHEGFHAGVVSTLRSLVAPAGRV
jgi:hypothetical protein